MVIKSKKNSFACFESCCLNRRCFETNYYHLPDLWTNVLAGKVVYLW